MSAFKTSRVTRSPRPFATAKVSTGAGPTSIRSTKRPAARLIAWEEIAQQQFDAAVAAATVAEASVASAEAAVKEAQTGVTVAESRLQQSQAGVRQAQAAQSATRTAPAQVRSAACPARCRAGKGRT